ncbi:MAG: hypothetical protein FWD17_06400 [Polyangiaceae bacterium]|nr:hypothetical protein [Polyangiaceae bacterium]
MAGRRFRSTHGTWSIPYVDDARLVFTPKSPWLFDAVSIGFVVLVQVASCAVLAMNGATGLGPMPVWFRVIPHVGIVIAGMLIPLALPSAVGLSRIHSVRRRLELARVGHAEGGHGALIEGTADGRPIAPTATRVLVHGNAQGQERLLVRLGDEVYELWQSPTYGGGGVSFSPEGAWEGVPLAGGEGSAPAGETERGDGLVLPIVESLRRVLVLGRTERVKVVVPGGAGARFGVLVLTVAVCGLMAELGKWLDGLPALASLEATTRGAIGLGIGLAVVSLEALVVWAYLRAMIVPLLNRLADAVIRGTASPAADEPYR